MFTKIATIAWKDALIRFSGRSEILFFFVLPVVFTYLLGTSGVADGPSAIPVLVVDEDHSALSAGVVAALEEAEAIEVRRLARAEAEAELANEAAPALLIIPAGFEATLLGGRGVAVELQQLPNNGDAQAAGQAVLAAIGRASAALEAAHNSVREAERVRPFASAGEREAYFNRSLEMARQQLAEAPALVAVTQPDQATVQANSFDLAAHQSAGQLITWVFIPFLATSGLLAFERTQGTLRRLVITPTPKATFLLGTITGQLGLGLVQMALLVGFGTVVMGVNWGQSPAALLLMLVAFGLASVALGTMLGTFVKTESQASSISVMAGMALALLGGCWFPLELFPEAARTAVYALPTTWAMQGLTDLVLRGRGLADVLPEAGMLVGFAVVFFLVGVWRFRYE
ncbi:MAG: ABC transporter permease [Chloroflexi bacterium]|nr:ABC transporter permease [Chloroflexota bacterium]MCI0646542.1 ABC transporter permease [Chloroflexota bacterium]MCI0726344.1 ABC transporter permease [Chloroflexota bacterium]